MIVMYERTVFEIWLDSGASVSFITLDLTTRLELKIAPNGQLALLADASTRMKSLGEVHLCVHIKGVVLRLRALVVESLPVDCYGGTTFHVENNITTDIARGLISIHDRKSLFNNLTQVTL